MTKQEAIAEIKARYREVLQPDHSGKGYICPLCGSGSGRKGTGLAVDPNRDGTQLHCFACGFDGDIIDLYKQENGGIDFNTALNELADLLNIEIDGRINTGPTREARQGLGGNKREIYTGTEVKRNTGQNRGLTEEVEPLQDFTEYYRQCSQRLQRPEEGLPGPGLLYLAGRGISPETAARFGLGFDPEADPAAAPGAMKTHPAKRIIIPLDSQHYQGRRISDNETDRPKVNSRGGGIPLFNPEALQSLEGDRRPAFIVEGPFDVITIYEANRGHAAALCGRGNSRKLVEYLKAHPAHRPIILALDADSAGQKATQTLAEQLQEAGILFTEADTGELYGGCKDPNEAYLAGPSRFAEALNTAEAEALKDPDSTAEYVAKHLRADIADFTDSGQRKTGFKTLDAVTGGIYFGLYIIGGTSSIGKTSFILQLADQIAEAGQSVIIFSMEQGKMELVTKSLARLTAIRTGKDRGQTKTALEIRKGQWTTALEKAGQEYRDGIGQRINIIEGGSSRNTATYIGQYIQAYIRRTGTRPVVFVDYLQILEAPEGQRAGLDTRSRIDANLTELRRISRDNKIPVFVVSSLNRSNYITEIDFESFKESGNIEYAADSIWGLQLKAIHSRIFDKDQGTAVNDKRRRIREAKKEIPRQVELVCLKDRNGAPDFTIGFQYYPQFDLFEELEEQGGADSAAITIL